MPQHVLYGGRVVVDFEEQGHIYSVTRDGEALGTRDSVTKILKAVDMGKSDAFAWWGASQALDFLRGHSIPASEEERDALFYDAQRAHIATRDEAASVGKGFHSWIEAHIKAQMEFGEDPALPDNEEERNAVLGYLAHEAEHGLSYRASEQVIYSLEHDYIGTLDHIKILVMDGELGIGDYKSAADMRITFRLQLAAYAKAYMEERPDQRLYKRVVYLLGKDEPKCTPIDLCYPGWTDEESLEFDFAGFLAAQGVYRWGLKAIAAQPPKKRKKKAKE